MTPLRAKYIRDLVVRGRSKHTQEAYTRYVRDLARYYGRSPELISYDEVTDWVYHLITERLLSASSVNVAVNAVRFLYAVTLGRETVDLMASVPHMKRSTRCAEVYARSEVEAILTAPRQPRDRALLMTVYGCGLRISEATQLKTSDIDRPRMQLRVRNGKGAKGRVLPLSERLLKELENYWRAQRQGKAGHDIPWLFLAKKTGEPAACRLKILFVKFQIIWRLFFHAGAIDTFRLRFSVNLDRHSHGNLINYSSRVPVCQADAPVAGRTTDRIRAVGTMNADALFVHTNPDDPNRITWTRWDIIKVAASPSMLQH